MSPAMLVVPESFAWAQDVSHRSPQLSAAFRNYGCVFKQALHREGRVSHLSEGALIGRNGRINPAPYRRKERLSSKNVDRNP
jgi:hypothetical protein